MGEFVADVIDAVKFGFSWIHDRQSWKFFGALVLTYVLLFAVIVGSIAAFFLSSGIVQAGTGSAGYWRHLFTDPSAFLNLMVGAFLFFLIVAIAFVSLFLFVGMYLTSHALKMRGLATVPLNMPRFASVVWLELLLLFNVLFSWKDKRFLALLGFAVLMFVGSASNRLLLFPAVLVLIFYIPVMAYMGLRFYFAPMALLHEDLSAQEALDFSWKLSKGRVLGLFARNVGSVLVISTLLALVMLVPKFLLWILGLLLGFHGNAPLVSMLEGLLNLVQQPVSTLSITFATVHLYYVYLQVVGLAGKPGSKPLKKSIRRIPSQ